MTEDTADIISNIQIYYVVPDGVQATGVKSPGYRVELKHKAYAFSR